MAKKAKAAPGPMELPVHFSNVSIGDTTCRIGVGISRGNITVAQADASMCGRRLTGKLIAQKNGDAPGQAALPGIPDPELEGIFDVKGFSVTTKRLSIGLTFALAGMDLATLAGLAKRDGRLIINKVEDLDSDDEEEEE